jgi:hypothetical protein
MPPAVADCQPRFVQPLRAANSAATGTLSLLRFTGQWNAALRALPAPPAAVAEPELRQRLPAAAERLGAAVEVFSRNRTQSDAGAADFVKIVNNAS